VGALEPIDTLVKEYGQYPRFLRKIHDAKTKYTALRRVRGDGSCFYRAYIFGVMEYILTQRANNPRASALLERFTALINESFAKLVAVGFNETAIETFWDVFLSELQAAKTAPNVVIKSDDLVLTFADSFKSDSFVTHARFMTSYHLLTHAKEFGMHVPLGKTMEQFVKAEVEPVGKECEFVQCAALAAEFDVPVRIEYLDQSDRSLNGYVFPLGTPDTVTPVVHLLYRPGHYDILYPVPSTTAVSITKTPTTAIASNSTAQNNKAPTAATASATTTTTTTPTTAVPPNTVATTAASSSAKQS